MRDKGGKAPAGGAKGRDAKKKKEKGGTRSFVTSAEDLEHRNMLEEQKQSARKARRADDDDDDDEDDDEDDDSEEESDDDANANIVAFERVPQKSLFGFSQSADGPAMETKPKKKSGIQGILKIENPNMKPAQNKVMKAKDMTGGVEQQLSRREREALEKEAAAARYMKKHLAGETEEAKKDLARLQEVKRRREEAEQRKREEEAAMFAHMVFACLSTVAAAEREKAKKKVVEKNDDEPLDARAIKALKPNVLKDYLKERGLSIQGQKKDLIQRLIDYENERAL
ncbi:28 kda heat-and acid-stable phospho, partial [Globisporangium splendens]